jgi:hypothetical protein
MLRDAATSSTPLAKVVENRQTKPLKAASIVAGSASFIRTSLKRSNTTTLQRSHFTLSHI